MSEEHQADNDVAPAMTSEKPATMSEKAEPDIEAWEAEADVTPASWGKSVSNVDSLPSDAEEAFARLPGDTATSVLARINVEVAEKRRIEWTAQRRIIVVLVVAGLALLVGGVTAVLTPGCWLAAAILTWVWKMRPLVRWSVTGLSCVAYFAMFVLVGALMHR